MRRGGCRADGAAQRLETLCWREAGDGYLRRTVDRVFDLEDAAASRLTAEERASLLALGQKLLDAFRAETDEFLKTTSTGD